MTLGEHPGQGRSRGSGSSLDRFFNSEFDIGKFRDVGHLRRRQPLQPGRRRDHGRLRQRRPARHRRHLLRPHPAHGLLPQQGGRDLRGPQRGGRRDRPARRAGLLPDRLQQRRPPGHLHPPRGLAPLSDPADASCATTATARFTDVTKEAGLLDPVNSNTACLGRLRQRRLARPVRLLRAAAQPPLSQQGKRHLRGGRRQGRRARSDQPRFCKGCTWIDFDNDGYPDLFLNNLDGAGQLYRNNRDGTFTDVTSVNGHRRAPHRLLVLGLGLRQRRLARHLRHLLRPLARRRGQGPARPAAQPVTPTGSSATWRARASRT